MRNLTDGSVNTHPTPKFEGFEQRLLDELKILVAERAIEVTDPVVTAKPGRSPLRMPAWRQAGLVGAAGLAAGSLAVAALFMGGGRSAPQGNVNVELTSFLSRAAAAARSHAVALPKPGQVLVERVRAGETGPKTGDQVGCYLLVYDTPASGRASFPTKSGPCGAHGHLSPYVDIVGTTRPGKGGVTAIDLKPGQGAHGYPDPAKLPVRPAALLAALNRDARGNWDTGSVNLGDGQLFASGLPHSAIIFGLIERLLQVPIRPALRAALFEVTGKLPGIQLDRHATDLIGRPGMGIVLPLPIKGSPSGIKLEFVINAKTYRFLGVAMTDGIGHPGHPTRDGYSVIKSALVTPKR